jgi:DNA-binding HxlR family transcriptional regulator
VQPVDHAAHARADLRKHVLNEFRRGLPKMSPALLSKRLKELQQAGVVTVARKPNGSVVYRLSEAGEELRPLIMGLGNWHNAGWNHGYR